MILTDDERDLKEGWKGDTIKCPKYSEYSVIGRETSNDGNRNFSKQESKKRSATTIPEKV